MRKPGICFPPVSGPWVACFVVGVAASSVMGCVSDPAVTRVGTSPAALDAPKLYVSPTGSDTNPGTLEAPLATVRRALTLAQPGYEIRLLPGNHVAMGSSPVRF